MKARLEKNGNLLPDHRPLRGWIMNLGTAALAVTTVLAASPAGQHAIGELHHTRYGYAIDRTIRDAFGSLVAAKTVEHDATAYAATTDPACEIAMAPTRANLRVVASAIVLGQIHTTADPARIATEEAAEEASLEAYPANRIAIATYTIAGGADASPGTAAGGTIEVPTEPECDAMVASGEFNYTS